MPPRTPLVSPRTFFAEHGPDAKRLIGVLTLVLLVWPALMAYGVSLVLALRLDTAANGLEGTIWSVAHSFFGQAIGTAVFLLVVLAGGLHLATRLAGGQRGVGTAVHLAAWTLTPILILTIVLLGIMYVAIDPTTGTGTPGGIESATTQVRSAAPSSMVFSLVMACWSGAILRYGLEYEYGLTNTAAWTITGIFVAVLLLPTIS